MKFVLHFALMKREQLEQIVSDNVSDKLGRVVYVFGAQDLMNNIGMSPQLLRSC